MEREEDRGMEFGEENREEPGRKPEVSEDEPRDGEKSRPGGEPRRRTRTEEFQVSGRDLTDRVRKLLAESNVRRIILRRKNGQVLLEIPMTAGLAVGGVAVVFAPVLVALGAIAMFLTNVSIVVVREDRDA
jgi:hypothetical protein